MTHCLARLTWLALTLLGATPAFAQQFPTPNRDSAEYYFQRGASFYEDHRLPDSVAARGRRWAMTSYSRSLAFDSSYYWSYRNRGYCHENFGELTQALANYDHAVAAGLRSGEADAAFVRFDALYLCVRLHRWTEAEAHCSALLANPHICAGDYCDNVWRTRADTYVQLGRYAEARQDYLHYQQAIAPKLASADRQLAEEQLRQAQQHRPRHLSRVEKARWQAGNAEELVRLSATAAELRAAYTDVAVKLVELANR